MTSNKTGKAFPFPTASHHPAAGPTQAPRTEHPTEDAIDHGIEESAAGEEDPGAALDLPQSQPGDEAAPGTQGTGEGICRECGGTGRAEGEESCASCSGTGKVTVGIGGA